MNNHEDETHALIAAVEALCFALRAKQSALTNILGHQKHEDIERMKDILRDTTPINQPGDQQ